MPDPVLRTDALGKEDFLRLLVTQLRHQDPLQPLDAQDFAAQLAQFTALEQQIRTNELLEAASAERALERLENQKSVAVGLLGRGVVAPGVHADLSGSTADAVYVSTAGAGSFEVRLTDASGRTYATTASATSAGIQRVAVGSLGLAPGRYTVEARSLDGSMGLAPTPLASGVVTGVRMGSGGPVLVVGDREIPLVEVVQITS